MEYFQNNSSSRARQEYLAKRKRELKKKYKSRNTRTSVALDTDSENYFLKKEDYSPTVVVPNYDYKSSAKKITKSSRFQRALSLIFLNNINSLLALITVLLTFRLVLMDRGVMFYFNQDELIQSKEAEIITTNKINEELSKEIKKIQSNKSYQKKMARQYLDVVAKDEYLVIFSQRN